MYEVFNSMVLKVNDLLTGSVLLIALVGAGIWFSFKLGFIQVRGFGESMRRTFGGLFSKKVMQARTVCHLFRLLQPQSQLR